MDRFETSMSDSDSLMWTIEDDPVLRSTVTAVSLLDQAPDWDRVVQRILVVAGAIPRLRQRVHEHPLHLARPEWADTEFDLGYHLRRIALPQPASFEDALEVARAMAIGGFDMTRPLWEFVVVEGLDGGQAALIQKIHHTVTDGVGGVRLALELLDAGPDAEEPGSPAPHVPRPSKSLAEAVWVERSQRLGAVLRALPGLAGAATRAFVRSPALAMRNATATGRSVAHMLAPVTEPMSPILRGRGESWAFTRFDVPLDALRTVGRRNGVTINDAFVAAVTMGLQRYHAAFGAAPPALRMMLPVSFRKEGDPPGGNRFTPLRFAIPVGGAEGDERVRAVASVLRAERNAPGVPLTPLLAAALDALPTTVVTPVFGGMLKNVDFVATNVPGVPFRCWFGGAEVLRQYAFAPPSGAAVNIALLSHGDTACIGVASDTTPVADPALLTQCLKDAFAALIGAPEAHRRAS